MLAIAIIVMSRPASRMVSRCWPMFALGAIGLLSALWSINVSATIRNSYNFLSLVLFTLAFAGTLSAAVCFRLVLKLMALACALSIVWFCIP